MNHKPKKCKGIGKAKDFSGCGGMALVRKLGLCSPCYVTWLRTTPEGMERVQRYTLKAKKNIETKKKKERDKKKVQLLSPDGYRKKYIQPKINELIRIIDYGQPCIATGATKGKANAGHFWSTGANRTLTYHAHNIFLQSEHSNSYKGGDDKNYRLGLIDTFGVQYTEWIEGLRKCEPIKLNKTFLETLNKKLIEYKPTIEKVKRTARERIIERNKLNKYLGIYPKEYLEYFLD